jgi:uncharacterized protein YecA (UPF0149 family)
MNTETGQIIDLDDDSAMRHTKAYLEARAALESMEVNPSPGFRPKWKAIPTENLSLGRLAELHRTGKTKIGRNEGCPCGSGKKFKKCCMTAKL